MTLIKFKNSDYSDRNLFRPSVLGSFFNDFMNSDLMERNLFQSNPAVNITETNDKFIVELAAPGMKKEDFKIEVENKVLNIRAEKKDEKNEVNSRFIRREFSYSMFERSFTLPENVSNDAIAAEYEHGVLKLHIPKKDDAKQKPVREIAIS